MPLLRCRLIGLLHLVNQCFYPRCSHRSCQSVRGLDMVKFCLSSKNTLARLWGCPVYQAGGLQVELNTIASSFGALSTLVSQMHGYILKRAGAQIVSLMVSWP